MKTKTLKMWLGILGTCLLSACGGGDNGGPAAYNSGFSQCASPALPGGGTVTNRLSANINSGAGTLIVNIAMLDASTFNAAGCINLYKMDALFDTGGGGGYGGFGGGCQQAISAGVVSMGPGTLASSGGGSDISMGLRGGNITMYMGQGLTTSLSGNKIIGDADIYVQGCGETTVQLVP